MGLAAEPKVAWKRSSCPVMWRPPLLPPPQDCAAATDDMRVTTCPGLNWHRDLIAGIELNFITAQCTVFINNYTQGRLRNMSGFCIWKRWQHESMPSLRCPLLQSLHHSLSGGFRCYPPLIAGSSGCHFYVGLGNLASSSSSTLHTRASHYVQPPTPDHIHSAFVAKIYTEVESCFYPILL